MKAVTTAPTLAALCLLASSALAQAPAAVTYDAPSTGFTLPVAGQMTYAVSGGESIEFGSGASGTGSGNSYTTNVGGSLGILTGSETHPFSALFGGGASLSAGANSYSSYYQSLAVSQQFLAQYWKVLVSNTLRFTPNIALGGVSGVAGAGDLGSGTAGGTGAGLFTPNQNRLDESAAVSAGRPLTGATQIQFGGGYSLLHATGQTLSSVDSSTLSGNASLDHHLGARTSVDGGYSFFRISQPSTNATTIAHSVTATVERQLTAKSSLTASGGPQFIQTNFAGLTSSQISYSADASYTYSTAMSGVSVNFDHGLRNTTQANAAAETLTTGVSFSRTISPVLHVSALANYLRTSALQGAGANTYGGNSVFAAFQANRSLSRRWSTYFSYTLEKQIVSGNATGFTPLQGMQHFVAVGITFSPLPIQLHGHS